MLTTTGLVCRTNGRRRIVRANKGNVLRLANCYKAFNGRPALRFLVALLVFFSISAMAGKQADREEKVLLGDTKEQVERKLSEGWKQVTNLVSQPPYSETIPYTNKSVMSQWVSKAHLREASPAIFVIFSDAGKSEVADVLLAEGETVWPLVEGPYSKAVASLAQGTRLEEVFAVAGRRQASFEKVKGRWILTFNYIAYPGVTIIIDVDPQTMKVIRIGDSRI